MLELRRKELDDENPADNSNDGGSNAGADESKLEENSSWAHNLPKNHIAGTWQGLVILFFGVALPGLLLSAGLVACYDRIVLLIWKHPIETIAELAILLSIPLGNLLVWSALCKNDPRHAIRRGIFNGISIGGAALVTLVTCAASILKFPTVAADGTSHVVEFGIMGLITLFAMATGIALAGRTRETRIIQASRAKAVAYVAFGVVLAFLAFIAAEARSTVIKVAEYLTTSDLASERANGLNILKSINPERELRMECSSRKASGLPGLFIRVDNDKLRQLHFAITGKTFGEEQSQNFASMTNEYLKNHVVGEPVEGLTLDKSAMFGVVNPDTASSTVYWSFVFKNRTYEAQEARAELALPEGAVVSGMTVWQDGRPFKTEFAPTGVDNNDEWSNIGHDASGVVTDLGRGRMLLHCYPVASQGYLRMSVAVTVPLKLHTITDATLALPRFLETNFNTKNGKHFLRLVSSDKLDLAVAGVKPSPAPAGQYLISGPISSEVLSGAGLAVSVKRPAVYGPLAIQDNAGKPSNQFLIQTIRELPAKRPDHVVVVVDSSIAMKEHLPELKKVLAKLPDQLRASLVVPGATDGERPDVVELKAGLEQLSKRKFDGGEDNLEAVVAATGVAGESKQGAVLWIHGPQPGFNNEIYLMSPYMYAPSFYELALDDGVMDAAEYFKNHREIGPFLEIARSASPAADLDRFLSKWKPGGHDYVVEYQMMNSQPKCKLATTQQCSETAALFARERVSQFLRQSKTKQATEIALYHRIVTPVSLALCSGSILPLESERLAEEHGRGNVRIFDGPRSGNPANNLRAQADSASTDRGYQTDASVATTRLASGSETTIASAGDTASPILQGASNGTIGPTSEIGPQCVSIMGVNTAGTVRVNNLANLESMLCTVANCMELLGIGYGALLLLASTLGSKNVPALLPGANMSITARVAWGVVSIAGGLATPGCINYMVASARDANLFS